MSADRFFNRVNLFRLVCLLTLTPLSALAALPLHKASSDPLDLALSGDALGLADGEKRWIKWSDLRALPTQELLMEGEFLPGTQKVTVVLLASLLENLPVTLADTTVLAECTDGYLSIFDPAFTSRWKPVVVLEIDGRPPSAWPPPGLNYNPGPYVVTVDEKLTPGVKQVLDIDHKRPWGVNHLILTKAERAVAPFSEGRWATLSPQAQVGRDLWVNSCLSCHVGPGESLGGKKAGRPFAVLAAYAEHNPTYFKKYVRAPQEVMPGAKMTAHPHYTDEQLKALIAFIKAERP